MGKSITVELNSSGIRELLRSDEIRALLKEKADAIADRCGAGYASNSKTLSSRAVASAYTQDFDAMRDNLKNNTLLRAMK